MWSGLYLYSAAIGHGNAPAERPALNHQRHPVDAGRRLERLAATALHRHVPQRQRRAPILRAARH